MFSIMPFNRRDDNFFDMFDKFFTTQNRLPAFRTDIRDENGVYILESELPGFSKEDITLDLKEGILTIRAEHKEEQEEKDDKGTYLHRERRFGSYSRSFDVSGVDADSISASYDKGILTLHLPKIQPEIPPVRRIEIN